MKNLSVLTTKSPNGEDFCKSKFRVKIYTVSNLTKSHIFIFLAGIEPVPCFFGAGSIPARGVRLHI